MGLYDMNRADRWTAAGRDAPPDGLSSWSSRRGGNSTWAANRSSILLIVLSPMVRLPFEIAQAARLGRLHGLSPAPNYWAQSDGLPASTITIIIMILAVSVYRTTPRWRGPVLALTPLLIFALWTCATRPSFGIVQNRIVVRSALPWARDQVVGFEALEVVGRGCHVLHQKYGERPVADFIVGWGPEGRRQRLNLGQRSGPGWMKNWAGALAGFARSKVAAVPSSADPSCVDGLARQLDATEAGRLRQLLN